MYSVNLPGRVLLQKLQIPVLQYHVYLLFFLDFFYLQTMNKTFKVRKKTGMDTNTKNYMYDKEDNC